MTDDDNLIDKEGKVDEDELDRRIRELGLDETPSIEQAKQEGNKIDEEFSARLKALEERAQAAKQVRDRQAAQVIRKEKNDRESAIGLGIGLTIAYTIIGMPLLGVGIGWILDKALGTTLYKGIGVVVGSAVGITAAIVMLSRANKD